MDEYINTLQHYITNDYRLGAFLVINKVVDYVIQTMTSLDNIFENKYRNYLEDFLKKYKGKKCLKKYS